MTKEMYALLCCVLGCDAKLYNRQLKGFVVPLLLSSKCKTGQNFDAVDYYKIQYLCTRLHGVIFQKTVKITVTATRILNLKIPNTFCDIACCDNVS
jgi:hypothetical protein